jgi:uncharacterized metal-binding protein
MTDGVTHVKYHNKFWIPSLVFSAIINILIFRNNFVQLILFESFFVICYWLGENIIGPDLDLISISSQDGRMITFGEKVAKKLSRLGFIGSIIGFFVGIIPFMFSAWSSFYAYTMQFLGGHRNIFSHSPILSTLGRMIWFNIIIFIILLNVYSIGVANWNWSSNYVFELYLDIWLFDYFLAQFIAWSISDLIHLFLDSERFKHINKK